MTQRVGILTLPLHNNYGGILQAAALYKALENAGKTPVLLSKKAERPIWTRAALRVLQTVPGQNIGDLRARERERAIHYPFIAEHLPNRTGILRTREQFSRALRQLGLDAVVVGSDQVWRFEYHGDDNPMIYFLDFAEDLGVRRISYAASFGQKDWAYPRKTEEASRLLAHFDAVSARETSGVQICRTTLGRPDAALCLDPTLLLDRAHYAAIAAKAPPPPRGAVLNYVLDRTSFARDICGTVIATCPGIGRANEITIRKGGAKPDIPAWLRAFQHANFVVTDSFHGTVFSILFERNFISIPNRGRGVDRFTSLLDQLGLADRIFTGDDPAEASAIAARPIDYATVGARLDKLRVSSSDFLLGALSEARAEAA
ncbi:MAG: polysaccharide pyruvyl transferase family protein [Rhodobacteraceae bacterium]|nr:polysaccharide pyruvyl transferase family protein [Paracoccaceae bacterium]